MEEFDYYEILEIDKTATQEEIKKSFRKMALKYHPDRNQGDKEAEETFKKLNEAYNVLSDENKRAIYDRYGKKGLEGISGGSSGFGSGNPFDDIADIFDSFFGGGSSRRRREQREDLDIATEIEIEFLEAVFGCKKEVKYRYEKPCSACNGSGSKDGKRVTCPTCHGKGQIFTRQGFMTFSQTCPTCHGSGTVVKEKCPKCAGTGKEKIDEKLTVDIPAGIDSGNRMRVAGKGSIGKSGRRGDLYLFIHVKEDKIFVRDGNDIYVEVPVFFTLAVLGGKIKIHTLRGEKEIEIKRNTRDKTHIVLRGEGVSDVHSGIKGDMIAQIKIIYPQKLTDEQEELLKNLHKSFGAKEAEAHRSFFEDVMNKIKGLATVFK